MTTEQLKQTLHKIAEIDKCFHNFPIDPVVESVRNLVYLHIYNIALDLTNTEDNTNPIFFKTMDSFKDRLDFVQWAKDNYEPNMNVSLVWHPIARMCLYLMETNAGQTMVKRWIQIFSSVK